MMQALGWIIWAAAAMYAMWEIPFALRTIGMNPQYAPHTLTGLVLNWVGVIAIPVFGYSPLHLLWWFPAAFLVSCAVAGIFYHITGGGRELRQRKRAAHSKQPDEL